MATAVKKTTARKPAAKKATAAPSTLGPPETKVPVDVPLQISPATAADPGPHPDTSTLAGIARASNGTTGLSASQAEIDAKVRELLLADDPMWAVFFDKHNEIYRAIRDLYIRDNGYLDPLKLKNAILATNEWRSQSTNQRSELQLKEQDPGTWQQKRDNLVFSLRRTALQLGLTIDDATLFDVADQAFNNGWANDSTRLQSLLFVKGSPNGGGQIAGNAAQLRTKLARYGLPVNDSQIADWARNLAEGTLDPDAVDEMIRNQAKARFPHLANAIDQGLTPDDYYAPYKSALANELEMNPNAIDFFNDPQWSSVIDGGASGRPMTLTEAARFARSLPQWQTTEKANRQAASMELKILSTFGKVA